MVETERIVKWLSRLVQIPSVGPANAGPRSGNSSEARLASQIAEWFTQFGGEVSREDVYPGRPNTYGVWHNNSRRWIAVDVHIDTVGVETMQGDPFDGRVENGRLYGRGAVDTKASLGIVLALLEQMHENGKRLDSNLIVCASADEETGCHGAAVFAEWVRRHDIPLDQLLVAEPTLCAPVYGHKGLVGVQLEIHGVAAHSAKPESGKNAIMAAAPLLLALDAEHQRLISQPPSTEVGVPTLAVTLIDGGQAFNVVPDRCHLALNRRLVPGEDPMQVGNALFDYAKQHCSLPLTMTISAQMTAFYQHPGTAWIKQLSAWSGVPAGVVPYGTNAWAYGGLAGDCVIFGPGSIDQAHRDVEWVEVSELEKAAAVYEKWWGLVS
jgi:acetylornithine deacetylase/succinyl-diaminopimelate desuccinylase-like protein